MNESDDHSWGEPGIEGPGSTSPSLLGGVKAGDEASRARLVALYLPLVYHRYLAKVPKGDRPDLAQQVFATVFQKIDGFEKQFDGPAFRGWLYKISYYKVGDYIRKTRKARGSPDGVGGAVAGAVHAGGGDFEEPSGPDRDDERRLLIRRVLEMVRGEFERDTYTMACQLLIEGRRGDEVAAALGKSANAAYVAKSRVLKRVRRVLEELGEYSGAAEGRR